MHTLDTAQLVFANYVNSCYPTPVRKPIGFAERLENLISNEHDKENNLRLAILTLCNGVGKDSVLLSGLSHIVKQDIETLCCLKVIIVSLNLQMLAKMAEYLWVYSSAYPARVPKEHFKTFLSTLSKNVQLPKEFY